MVIQFGLTQSQLIANFEMLDGGTNLSKGGKGGGGCGFRSGKEFHSDMIRRIDTHRLVQAWVEQTPSYAATVQC